MADETIHATIKRTGNQVSVSISQNDQEKAGIAHLEYHLVPSQPPDPADPIEPNIEDHPIDLDRGPVPETPEQLRGLARDLARNRELLEGLGSLLHELRLKRSKYGSALPAGAMVELREAEQEEQRLKAEIVRLETILLMGKKSLIVDPRPLEKLK